LIVYIVGSCNRTANRQVHQVIKRFSL
jgi:hypothetical protein